jgi:hypothetical protein
MPQPCEACESAKAEIVEPCDDPQEPYHLCTPCHHRLHARALRPIEWYNLAKRHGWFQFLLHDDFYEEDGSASQPDEDVERPWDFPAPALEAVTSDPSLLLDYSITRWQFTEDLAAAWAVFDPARTLVTLSGRFAATRNAGVRACILETCASAVRESGADFVRYAWSDYPESVELSSLATASAACLPFREGFDRVVSALDALSPGARRQSMFGLGCFHHPAALDWIERHVFSPTTDGWGNLASVSSFSWPRAEQWLSQGRPLSHVALSALEAIIRQRPRGAYIPHLLHPPSEHAMREVLSAYAARDPVPRVQNGIRHILAHAAILTNGA